MRKTIKERIEGAQAVNDRVYQKIRDFERAEEDTAEAFRAEEKKKFEQFLLIASEAQYFSLDHIDALGLEYDILIFVSEKNIGKTTAIYNKMREAKKEGKKSIFLRIQAKEVEAQMTHFNMDTASPFYAAKSASMYYFFDKKDYNDLLELEDKRDKSGLVKIRYSKALDMGLEPWGFATYFGACNTSAGGSYENYKYIFIDEFITWAKFKVFDKGSFENWTAFPSSIARNKKELKVFMFGNLKSTNNDILNFYGIKDSDNLRYIRRGFIMCDKHKAKYGYTWNERVCSRCLECEKPCRILYINADTIYRGVKRQSAIVRQARPKELATTLSNKVVTPSSVVVSPNIYDDFNIIQYFYIGRGKYTDPLLIEVRKAVLDLENCNDKVHGLAVKAIPFEAHFKFDLDIKTDSTAAYLQYRNLKRVASLKPIIKDLWLYAWHKKLYFADDDSLVYVTEIIRDFAKSEDLPF